MAEVMIETGGVELCTETFGAPTDPPVLLVMGLGASMLWWDEGFCRTLAGGWPLRDPLRPSRHRRSAPPYPG